MLWLFLLGVVTLLVINRRRLMLRIIPLDDKLYSTQVAVEHVHSGVGWVRADGMIVSMNQSLADMLGTKLTEMGGHEWYMMFPRNERARVKEAYTQMLLSGIASLDTAIERADGTAQAANLRMVAVHDYKMRLVGHHCMVQNISRERALEQQVRDLSDALHQAGYELDSSSDQRETADSATEAS
jgi:PAS domain S-box-containing protein